MAKTIVKKFKPITPGLRGKISVKHDLAKGGPEKTLTEGKRSISGRAGRISVRRRGGGHKRVYRIIDFKRDKRDIWGTVKSVEYDPNRTSYIALVVYTDGEKRYILATDNMKPGHKVIASAEARSEEGNAIPLKNINVGSFIHNIELTNGKGGQLVRAAGGYARLLGKDGRYVTVELSSGEVRRVLEDNYATVGVLSNKEKVNEKVGKAGKSRWMGKRPKVRGVVMNPVDHPMGGGEGRSSGGRHPTSPTGVKAKGLRTRSNKKYSTPFIIRRRKSTRKNK